MTDLVVVILALDDLVGAPVKSAGGTVGGLAAVAQPGGVDDPLYQPTRLCQGCYSKPAPYDSKITFGVSSALPRESKGHVGSITKPIGITWECRQ